MIKKEFQAESKRLMELVVNSIYTNREIFLREIISNASDAIDKLYYKALTDENISFNKEDFKISLKTDKEKRTLTISDTGIGMTEEEMDKNLGIIAQSGSYEFKEAQKSEENADKKEDVDIIGQFGIGFYSSFLVAKKVRVISKAFGSESAYCWESEGAEGYTITPVESDHYGTDIIIELKDKTEDEDYDKYLEEYTLRSLVRKYSNYIRYPIVMPVSKSRVKEGFEEAEEKEYESYFEEETLNTMVPIWRKNKNELTDDDYENFYMERHYGFDKPLRHIHFVAEGNINYRAILYIPTETPYNFYSKDYEKGLELYSSGILIMDKCGELLPDYFSFVKGVVDSEDLSLNISREMLQHDRQLRIMAKRINTKITEELTNMLNNDRDAYEKFYKNFGVQLKAGIYSSYGMDKDKLQDFLLFYSSKEQKLVSLKEYVERMPEDQKYIYYATGSSEERIDKLPQAEAVKEKGYSILYMTQEIDEFAIKMMRDYQGKEFKSIASGDLGLLESGENKEKVEETADEKTLFEHMKEILGDKVVSVKATENLKNYAVCFTTEGDLSIEMEKTLNAMPGSQEVKAEKVLEINKNHPIFEKLKGFDTADEEQLKLYTSLLYDQACLIDGLDIDDPVAFSANISKLM